MQQKTRFRILLSALAMCAAPGCQQPAESRAEAETTDAPPRGVPTFRVDPDWPSLPAGWVLGDVSCVSVDGQDNIWVLHRPRTVPPEQAEMAAPPLVVFDSDGNFIRALGRIRGRLSVARP